MGDEGGKAIDETGVFTKEFLASWSDKVEERRSASRRFVGFPSVEAGGQMVLLPHEESTAGS